LQQVIKTAVVTCPEQRNDFFPCAIRLDAILTVPH